MSIKWDQAYCPSTAENGKFVPVDMSTIAGYPSTYTDSDGLTGVKTSGRYALLTYNIGTDTGSTILSGGLPNSTTELVSTFSANTSSVVTFNPAITLMEISNRSSGSIYISYANPVTSFATLTANGLEISQNAFYSIERTVTSVSVGSVAGGKVIIFGHYKA
jgi:hypothetical protein